LETLSAEKFEKALQELEQQLPENLNRWVVSDEDLSQESEDYPTSLGQKISTKAGRTLELMCLEKDVDSNQCKKFRAKIDGKLAGATFILGSTPKAMVLEEIRAHLEKWKVLNQKRKQDRVTPGFSHDLRDRFPTSEAAYEWLESDYFHNEAPLEAFLDPKTFVPWGALLGAAIGLGTSLSLGVGAGTVILSIVAGALLVPYVLPAAIVFLLIPLLESPKELYHAARMAVRKARTAGKIRRLKRRATKATESIFRSTGKPIKVREDVLQYLEGTFLRSEVLKNQQI
jgi:hypothetical protein